MPRLQSNLETKGRAIRGSAAAMAALAALLLWPRSHVATIVAGGAAVFLGFEAARGWCALRACGVKTKF